MIKFSKTNFRQGSALLAFSAILTVGSLFVATSAAEASAIRPGFNSTDFPANDDGSVGPVALGMTISFFGNLYTTGYVNNNGNMTFTGPLATFTPFAITGGATPMLAPFFADVDTRGGLPGVNALYGGGVVGGRPAFGITWDPVGYFGNNVDKLNEFQLIVIDRSDIGLNDFDFEFNYDSIQWETGDASGGSGGLGGTSARAGWTNGAGAFFELAGSGVNGAFINGGVNALITHELNSAFSVGGTTDGRYYFRVRNGVVEVVPEPATLALIAMALLSLMGFGIMRQRSKI